MGGDENAGGGVFAGGRVEDGGRGRGLGELLFRAAEVGVSGWVGGGKEEGYGYVPSIATQCNATQRDGMGWDGMR